LPDHPVRGSLQHADAPRVDAPSAAMNQGHLVEMSFAGCRGSSGYGCFLATRLAGFARLAVFGAGSGSGSDSDYEFRVDIHRFAGRRVGRAVHPALGPAVDTAVLGAPGSRLFHVAMISEGAARAPLAACFPTRCPQLIVPALSAPCHATATHSEPFLSGTRRCAPQSYSRVASLPTENSRQFLAMFLA
jgi:hypothetical protein